MYIAAVMYISIVATALILNGAFAATGLTPQSARKVEDVDRTLLAIIDEACMA